MGISRKVLCLVLALLVVGCDTVPKATTSSASLDSTMSRASLRSALGSAQPPIVLRQREQHLARTAGLPMAKLSAEDVATALVAPLLAPLNPFYVFMPLALPRKIYRTSMCEDRWKAAVGDFDKWMESTLGPIPATTMLQEALRERFAAAVPVVEVASSPTGSVVAALPEIEAIADRLGSSSLVVLDIEVVLSPLDWDTCTRYVHVLAYAHLYRSGAGLGPVVSFIDWDGGILGSAIAEYWGDPGVAREVIGRHLQLLADEIVERYTLKTSGEPTAGSPAQ